MIILTTKFDHEPKKINSMTKITNAKKRNVLWQVVINIPPNEELNEKLIKLGKIENI
jgi:hypothetical protein